MSPEKTGESTKSSFETTFITIEWIPAVTKASRENVGPSLHRRKTPK
jgi:hypothetical protein